jgi:hypothetical protein
MNMELKRRIKGEPVLTGLPVGDHPNWPEFHQRYAEAYNAIADKCDASGSLLKCLENCLLQLRTLKDLVFVIQLI